MKECTLQEACALTKKQGGVFWGKDIIEAYKYHYDEYLNHWIDESGERFYLEDGDFKRIWLYEPPKKSAFQESLGQYPICGNDTPDDHRKKGWNAALDTVLEWNPNPESCDQFLISPGELEELKEP
jgi:hypothetical protein